MGNSMLPMVAVIRKPYVVGRCHSLIGSVLIFNPQRLNPVTHRIAPHYGTDLAVPVATPVLATGEGQVVRVGEHPLAGLYVVIKNGPIYSTRFLHLSRILVKVGQQVHQNEVIALSGNTGRSTGPHLHYELRKEGVPVNAMLAPLPQASGLTQRQSAQFKQKNRVLIHQLSDPF
uniref:Peptidoglycan DD-metalloendopeptidase family protein n=2 Tax=Vibrio algicola TaxID=2662262 RepID=A0A5Q0TEK3_9VIBR